VFARMRPAKRSGALRHSSMATYPPMDNPHTTARSTPASSSASTHRAAAADMVISSPAGAEPPNPGRCGATTGSRADSEAT
jgi:hypothetical protein